MDSLKALHERILSAGEPFVQDWPLTRDPVPIVALTIVYLTFVKWIGPALMRDRKPLTLKTPMALHNLFLISLNAWVCFTEGQLAWFHRESYTKCFLFGTKAPLQEALVAYVYYISKYIDWIDTIILVARKKERHISILHLYHHASMPLATWIFVKLSPGGHITYSGFINAFVHVIMYSYFFLASLGPHMQPYLGWKKYLTQLQMIQFATVFVHSVQWLFKPCGHPMILTYILCANSLFFFALFSNFYVQTYRRQAKRSAAAAAVASPLAPPACGNDKQALLVAADDVILKKLD